MNFYNLNMNNFIKYLSTIVLAVALLACGNDSEQPEQQQTQQQQPGQLGQMNQEAPDVDVSDEEAATFADAAMQAQQIQMQAQQKMVGVIKEEGLDIQTYQKIARSTRQGGQAPDSISENDMEKYQNATDSLKKMQSEIQEQVTNAIEETGMEMERFQNISRAAQQDTALQRQIQEQLKERMGQQMQQQPPQGNQ